MMQLIVNMIKYKVKEIYPNEYASPKDLRRAIARYIEQYNNVRPHAALDNQKPRDVYNSCFNASSNGLSLLPKAV